MTMIPSVSFIQLAMLCMALCSLQCQTCSGTEYRHFHIVPNNTIEGCTDNPRCVHFETFLQNTRFYITSNSTIEFFPGIYDMGQLTMKVYPIEIIGVTNVSISTGNVSFNGYSPTDYYNRQTAQIRCGTHSQVVWIIIQSQNIHIQNLTTIECSANINATNMRETLTDKILSSSTMFLVNVTNIQLSEVNVMSSSGTVLVGVNIEESLYINGCSFNGTLDISHSEDVPMTRNTTIQIHNSKVILGLHSTLNSQFLKQEGVNIKVANSVDYTTTLVIRNTSFYGNADTKFWSGSSLYVGRGSCSQFTIDISQIYAQYSGLYFKWFEQEKCNKCQVQNSISLENSNLTKIHHIALRAGAINTMMACNTLFVTNTSISESRTGLFFVQALVSLSNTTLFDNNKAVSTLDSLIALLDRVSFLNNRGTGEALSAIYFSSSRIFFDGHIVVENNTGDSNGAIRAKNSSLVFNKQVQFTNNQGVYGGALSMYTNSYFTILPAANVTFLNNYAQKFGGAIFVDMTSYASIMFSHEFNCFYEQAIFPIRFKRILPNLYFCNNTSDEGGDAIYGGSIDRCVTPGPMSKKFISAFSEYFVYVTGFCNNSLSSSSIISSKPKRLCFCINSKVQCNSVEINLTAVPGETINVSVTAVGQRYGTTTATVQVTLILRTEDDQLQDRKQPYITELQRRQLVYKTCTKLQYSIHAPAGSQTILLSISELSDREAIKRLEVFKTRNQPFPLSSSSDVQEVPLFIYTNLQDCSLGFVFDRTELVCVCHPYLLGSSIICSLSRHTIQRSGTICGLLQLPIPSLYTNTVL